MKNKKPPGLACPRCGGSLRVVFTRPGNAYIYRRRECKKCRHRVTTTERISGTPAPMSIPVPSVVSSVHDLIRSLGISPADLASRVTISSGDPHGP